MKRIFLLQTSIVLITLFLFPACSKKDSTPTPQNNAPTITALSTNSGPYNTSVIITGTGFSSTLSDDKVFFNGKQATATAATSTQITATVPLGAGTGNVSVSVKDGSQANGPTFIYQLSAVVTTLAGSNKSGSANGKGTAASFSGLWGITLDPFGNLFVTDAPGLVRKITPDGTVSFVAGNSTGLPMDGKGSSASFEYASTIISDASGNLYVADNSAIRKVAPDGTVTTVPGSRSHNGLASLTGLVFDAQGNIYASDVQGCIIIKIATDGTVTNFAGSGTKSSIDGKGTAASFNMPVGLAVDGQGNIFVVDEGSNEIRKVTPDGTVTTIAGNGSRGAQDGKGSAATFDDPTGVVVDASGNLYIGDFNNAIIRKITPDGTVSTIAGNRKSGLVDGIGTASQFLLPQDLAIDNSGNIYVADGWAVRKITFQ